MDQLEIYVRSMHQEYAVYRRDLIVFTLFFIGALLMIAVAWLTNHVGHNFQLGWMIAVVAAILATSMATHCGNTLSSLKRVATALNKVMGEYRTFEYDLGRETDPTRYVVTLIAKIIACLILLWCFTRWPQL